MRVFERSVGVIEEKVLPYVSPERIDGAVSLIISLDWAIKNENKKSILMGEGF